MDNYDLQDLGAMQPPFPFKKNSELPLIKGSKIPKQIIPEIWRENKWADFLNLKNFPSAFQ